MKRKSLLFLLLFALLAPWAANAQSLWSEDFEGGSMPTGWTTDGPGTWSIGSGDYSSSTGAGQGTYNALITHSTTNNVTKLITPEIDLSSVTSANLSFMHVQRSWAGDIDQLRVYYRTSTSETWTQLVAYTSAVASWTTEDDITLPNTSATYQLAFEHTDKYGYGVGIDDIRITPPATCPKPTLGEAEYITEEGASFQWTENGSATEWVLQYSTASDFTNPTSINRSGIPAYAITGLNSGTTYYVRLKSVCGGGDESDWSNTVSFSTECEAITAFPWTEDFESYASGNFVDPCWVNEHIEGGGTQIFKVYTYSNGNNSTHQLQLPDMTSGTMTKLRLPKMTLPNNNYLFAIDVYRNTNTSSYEGEGIRVFVSTDGEIAGATELAFISRNYTVSDNGLIPAESASGWYHYELPIGVSGTCYIILRGESKYGSATYMDNFAVKEAPACPTPTGLAVVANSVTAHTAQLSWTSEATAWIVAYKAADDADFTEVNANENPFTLTGLAENKVYTAKVRAVCDGTPGEEWTSTVSFTTPIACPAPTNLAYSGITGSQATLNWSGTSDSYDVLYRTSAYADGVYEQFNASSIPSGWTRYSGLVDEVVAGTTNLTSVSGYWNINSYALGEYNMKLNIYGSSIKHWLVTPEFELNQNLSFDLALTDYGNNDPIEDPTAQADDRFVVLIYANETWTILREWNNSDSDYVFNTISTTGENVSIDLSAYYGQNVKIAFYGESTATGGDNDLHIDNVYCGIPHEAGEWQTAAAGVTGNTYTLTGLSPETSYDVKVLSNCEGETGHEATISFTTEAACMVPNTLAVNYQGGTTAVVSWVSDATAWNIDVNGTVTAITENPYTLTGLELDTEYKVKVQAICGDATSDWSNVASFTTDACMPEEQLIINYTLTDSYGDGWNGNYILVVDASCDIVETLTISSGSTATGTLKICGGYAQFLWYKGNYPGETSWVFTDSEGNTLFEGAGNADMTTYDILYTIDNNPVAAPSDIMASEVGPHSAKLSWTENGTATAWQIMLNEDEENIIDANTNPFVLTGLDPETEYFVQVRAVTATGTSMWPCVGGGFTTDVPCPAPEVSVVPYPNSAEITMEGWAETYDIQMLQYSYTPSADALWLQYDDGTFATNIGNEGNYIWTWGVMYPASMLTNSNYLNKIAVYEIANYYTMANYTVEIYTGGDDAPGTLVHTESVAPAGIDGFHEVMLSSPVTIDPTQNLWITVTATGSYVLAACETTEANNQWVLSEDEEGNEIWANIGDLASSLAGYGWMIRGYIDNIAPDMNWTSVASGVASPYTLEGLDPETEYSIRVKALCGGEDGESEWTPTVTFTTPAACDAPNTLTATDVTGNSATLNWIGYQDRFNVRYRTTGYDEYSFFEDFENGLPSTWTTIDADGDGNTWYGIKQDNFAQYCHSGTGLVTSASYANSALTPDNWLVTPQIELQGTMKVWMRAQDPDWAEEHYAIYLSTTGNTVDDFTTVLVAETYDLTGEYIAVTADLSAYAGQQGYIAIRHFNCTDMFRINVDDFGIVTSSIEPGEWIDATADEETLAISGLTPETEYEWQVQGVNCDGEGTNTEWSEMATFTTGEQTNLTQTVALAASTNWFSTYVEITLEDLQAALDAVNTNNKAITIKTQNANSNYIPRTHRWSTPASFIWDVANMYQIVLTEACEITLEGAPIDPTEHEITIAGGGNSTWIGFPFSESMTLTNAFAALPPTNGDVVRYQSANAAYARNRWSTAIANLEPGKGYIYVSAASAGDRTLVFPTNAKRAAKGNVINPSDNSASSAISFPTDARKAAKVIDLNLNVKNTAKDTPYRIMKKAIKGVAKTVDETLTEIIK